MPLEQNLERICISTEFHLSLPVVESTVLLFHIFLAPVHNHFSVKLSSMSCKKTHRSRIIKHEKKNGFEGNLGNLSGMCKLHLGTSAEED